MTDEQPAPLPRSTPPAPENAKPRPRLPRWPVPLVAVLVLAATVAVLVLLWRWIDGLAVADPGQKDRATAQLDALKLAASIVVGGGGLFALYLAARRQRTQELELDARHAELAQRDEAQQDTRDDAAARRVTELYAKSVEQLGSEKAPVRLGGLYALERLAQDNPHQRQTVVNVLCAYLRMPYTLPGDPPAEDADEQIRVRYEERVQEREVRLAAQHILATHLRPGSDLEHPAETFWPGTDLDLAGATLINLNLTDCHLATARFDKTTFTGITGFNRVRFAADTGFGEATFSGDTGFIGTMFGNVDFAKAVFTENVGFGGATFTGNANFHKVRFLRDARFSGVTFAHVAAFFFASFAGEARFDQGAFAGGASFSHVTFSGHASFVAVMFAGSVGFDNASFAEASMFDNITFAETVIFDQATFAAAPSFNRALAAHPVPNSSLWPAGWRPGDEYGPVEGQEGVWHRLLQVDSDTSSGEEVEPTGTS